MKFIPVTKNDENWAASLGDRPLTKSQKVQLFEVLADLGLLPNEFEWRKAFSDGGLLGQPASQVVEVLVHTPTLSWFMFDGANPSLQRYSREPLSPFVSRFHPGEGHQPESRLPAETWDKQVLQFRVWAASVKREADTPDVWATIGTGAGVAGADLDNAPFTAGQQERLIAALERIEERVRELSSVEPERFETAVHAELQDLRADVKRLGKRDWRNVARGALLSALFGAGLRAVQASEFWSYAWAQISAAITTATPYVEQAQEVIQRLTQ